MGLNLDAVIDVIEKPLVPVTDEVAVFLTEVHEALKGLPGDRAVNVDQATAEDVKDFISQAKSWAEKEGKRFTRVGDIKGKPLRVSFRVVTKRATDTAAGTDAGSEAATSQANTTPATVSK
jgi:hypothetical protein